MKNKISFKFLALVMSLVICIVPILTVLSSAEGEDKCPIIDIHGLMASDIYVDPDDPDKGLVWPPSNDVILGAVKDAVPALAKFAVTKDWEAFGDDACKIANAIIGQLACDEEGNPVGKTGVRFIYPSPEKVKKGSVVSFKYDWRIDPAKVAVELNDFIDYVLKCSGSDKVSLTCHSLGGVITQTYLTMYGNSKIKGVCFNTTAIYGQTYVGELMTGKIVLDSNAVEYFLRYAFDYMDCKTLLNDIIAILNAAGVMDIVVNLGNTLVDHLLFRASKQVLGPLYGGWLSIWAMTRDEDIEEAEDFFFNTIYADEDRSVLKSKIDKYNEEIRAYKKQTLEDLNNNANVYVISRYGYSSIPITPSFDCPSDGVIDVKSNSFGATVAPYGQVLSDEQLAGVDPAYISPDKTINAATCQFPEQTWFIKNMQHSSNPDSIDEMIYTLLRHNGQATVDTFERYPRFNKYDNINDVISPETEVNTATFFEHIKTIIIEIVRLVKSLFDLVIKK